MNVPYGLKHPSTNLILHTTEKSNCTTIVKSFLKHINLLDDVVNYSVCFHDYHWKELVYKKDSDGSLPNMVTLDDLKNKNNIRIKFMRCPYDRAVSSYIHICRRIKKDNNCNYAYYTFNQFLRLLIKKRVLRYANPNIYAYAQTQSFIQENEFKWDEVLEVENPDYNSNLINEKYEIELDFNFINDHWVKTNSPITNKKISNTPFKDLDLKNINYVDFYGKTEKELVEKIYKIDFDCSNYTFERFIERNK